MSTYTLLIKHEDPLGAKAAVTKWLGVEAGKAFYGEPWSTTKGEQQIMVDTFRPDEEFARILNEWFIADTGMPEYPQGSLLLWTKHERHVAIDEMMHPEKYRANLLRQHPYTDLPKTEAVIPEVVLEGAPYETAGKALDDIMLVADLYHRGLGGTSYADLTKSVAGCLANVIVAQEAYTVDLMRHVGMHGVLFDNDTELSTKGDNDTAEEIMADLLEERGERRAALVRAGHRMAQEAFDARQQRLADADAENYRLEADDAARCAELDAEAREARECADAEEALASKRFASWQHGTNRRYAEFAKWLRTIATTVGTDLPDRAVVVTSTCNGCNYEFGHSTTCRYAPTDTTTAAEDAACLGIDEEPSNRIKRIGLLLQGRCEEADALPADPPMALIDGDDVPAETFADVFAGARDLTATAFADKRSVAGL